LFLLTTTFMIWSVVPRNAEPKKMIGIFLFGLVVIGLALVLTRQILFAIFGVCVIAFSTAEFWLGTRYILDEECARARVAFSGSEIKWSDVKSVNLGQSSIYLSPFAEEHRLDVFRGVKLNLTNADRDQVIELIRKRVGEDVRFLAG
jgi:hypothetical protein